MKESDRIAVALDVEDLDASSRLAALLEGSVGWFKVGLELFSAHGPAAVAAIRPHGPVFLDVKLHDIPTTVGRAARRLADLDVGLVTVHASGGSEMVAAAVEALGGERVLAVTVLTSLSESDLAAIGMDAGDEQVARLARLAVEAGARGLVCSPSMLPTVRSAVGDGPTIATPGVRPAGASTDDHAAASTPRNALRAGADLLVIGRPITRAADPQRAAAEIAEGLADLA